MNTWGCFTVNDRGKRSLKRRVEIPFCINLFRIAFLNFFQYDIVMKIMGGIQSGRMNIPNRGLKRFGKSVPPVDAGAAAAAKSGIQAITAPAVRVNERKEFPY